MGPIIEINNITNQFGSRIIHQDLSLTVNRGEILALVGDSGSGKTTLLRSILMLLKPTAGQIKIFDIDIQRCSEKQAQKIRQRWGVMFQQGALFSSLSVLENILFPLRQFSDISINLQQEIALLKLTLVGLATNVANQFPAQLSGGMRKRVALARAIALDPELVFLDEPTAGLDPASASALDALIVHLRDTLGLTVVIITHDLDTLWRVPDRVAFLGEKKVLAVAPMKELVRVSDPTIKNYFAGERGKKFYASPL